MGHYLIRDPRCIAIPGFTDNKHTLSLMPRGRAAQPQPSARSRTTQQPEVPEDGEFFNLNVSGSDSDGPQPARHSRRQAQSTTADADQHINNPTGPTPVQDSKKAADIHHFFERQGDSSVCKVCK
jgi:hypothetical protein